jgi:hypothetical protein
VFDLNQKLRVDKLLLRAFGYTKCADQSVIQQTLNAATEENVQQLEASLKAIWYENNLTLPLLENAEKEKRVETIDMDLSGMPASKKAEGSEKGYFAGKRNTYGRQLARVLVPKTQEISLPRQDDVMQSAQICGGEDGATALAEYQSTAKGDPSQTGWWFWH